jgi:signal transduction histidine kinase
VVLTVILVVTALVAGALILAAIDPLRSRREVDKVARLIAQTDVGSDVETILREGLGDPALRIGYWADGVGYLDRNGQVLSADPSRSRTQLTSRGAPLAVIVHSRDTRSLELLIEQLGQRARLAIHNESLMQELNRSVAELTHSRQRLVELGDAERRRLERDLHDGAQQQLLALSYEIRRGERASITAHDTRSATQFNAANALVRTALEQLRRLAHGIHPAMHDGASLEDALVEFAEWQQCPITVTTDFVETIPEAVQSAVYEVLTSVITSARPTYAPVIAIRRDDGQICVNIDRLASLPQHAIDRTEAAGGSWAATEHGFEVALPCAW